MTACPAAVHGSMVAFKDHGCTCPAARQANSRYEKRLRAEHSRGIYRLIDVTGSRRRIQALSAIGYSQPDLARRLGVTQQRVWQYLAGPRPKIRRGTAQRIAALYAELADTPSTGPQAKRTRSTAARHGWLSPLWWDDDTIDDPAFTPPLVDRPRAAHDVDAVIVDRLVEGTHVGRCTSAERFAAFLRLRAGGWPGKTIATHLGLSGTTYADYSTRADARGVEEAAA